MSDSQHVSRVNLLHGAALMLFGLLFGAAIGAAPYPRLALGAHIQFTTNGVMFLVAGLVIAHAGLGRGKLSKLVLTFAPWGAWVMGLSEAVNSWWGASKTLPIAAAQAGATGAAPWQENIVLAAHAVGALAVLAFWVAILLGLIQSGRNKG